MKVQGDPPVHLTYCLNVHPGESWQANFAAIREHVPAIRDRLARPGEFGLGLRLSAEAAATLRAPAELDAFRKFLADENLYVFTINGFPYGRFHGVPVKQEVYRPDWRTVERRDYTIALAEILAELLPAGVGGSISTVPGSYKDWIRTEADAAAMAGMIAETAGRLDEIRRQTGKEISLALEPEPDCCLGNISETLAFFGGPMRTAGEARLAETHGMSPGRAREVLARHVGVCFDTAHLAVEFEDLAAALARLRDAGVRVCKIHLSAAVRAATPAAVERLGEFADEVYLHQVRARAADGTVRSWADLPAALACPERRRRAAGRDDDEEWRVHFHVPLFLERFGELQSTRDLFTDEFVAAVRAGATEHLEIETYTFDVLPDELRAAGLAESIAREYEWVLQRMFPN